MRQYAGLRAKFSGSPAVELRAEREAIAIDDMTSRRVLVISDEPELIKLVKLILARSRNDQVVAAHGGQDGLVKAEQDPPDLIILDIMMPELDGWQVYARLKAIPSLTNTPVLFQAALASSHAYPLVKQAGAQGYLCLPYYPQDLLAARDAVLRGETYYPPLPEKTH